MPEPWEAVLDDLERRVRTGDASAWTPPAGIGPLPAGLESRALALLAGQREAIAAAGVELARIGDELSALRRPLPNRSGDRPAFLDTLA